MKELDKKKEDWLNEHKEKEERISLPKEISDRIEAGIYQAQKIKEKRSKRLQLFRISVASIGVAVILLFAGLATMNQNNEMSDVMNNPSHLSGDIQNENVESDVVHYAGFEKILEKPITKGDTTVTLTSVIADRDEAVIGYRVSMEGDEVSSFEIEEKLLNHKGEQISNVQKSTVQNVSFNIKSKRAFLEITNLDNKDINQNWTFALEIKKPTDQSVQTFEFEVPLDKEWFEMKSFTFNEALEFEDQKIHLIEVELSPIKAKIHLKLDQNNTEKLIAIDNLSIRNNEGIYWDDYGTRIISINQDNAIIEIPFNDDYNHIPEELYIQISNFYTENKRTQFQVDIQEEKWIQAPDKWTIKDITSDKNLVNMVLEYDGDIAVLENYLGQNVHIGNDKEGMMFINSVEKQKGKTTVRLYFTSKENLASTIGFELIHPKEYIKEIKIPLK